MRAIVKTLMIILATIEACIGVKRTTTISDCDENGTGVPLKEDQILGMLNFVLAMQMIQAAMSIQK